MSQRQAFLDHAAEVDRHRARPPQLGAEVPGAQHLLDRPLQAVAVLQHRAVELLPLGLVDGAVLQGLQIQLQTIYVEMLKAKGSYIVINGGDRWFYNNMLGRVDGVEDWAF